MSALDVDLRAEPQPQPRTGLVDEVDGLVGQHALGQVAVAELDGGAQRLVGVGDAVVLLVRGPQAAQDQHGVLDRTARPRAPAGIAAPAPGPSR